MPRCFTELLCEILQFVFSGSLRPRHSPYSCDVIIPPSPTCRPKACSHSIVIGIVLHALALDLEMYPEAVCCKTSGIKAVGTSKFPLGEAFSSYYAFPFGCWVPSNTCVHPRIQLSLNVFALTIHDSHLAPSVSWSHESPKVPNWCHTQGLSLSFHLLFITIFIQNSLNMPKTKVYHYSMENRSKTGF